MPRNVIVLFVHGINTDDPNYSLKFQDLIRKKLPKKLHQYLQFSEVYWADILRPRQHQYLSKAKALSGMRDDDLRKFVVKGLGDAAAYQKTRKRENSAYYAIQNRVLDKLRDANTHHNADTPLVFVGHSLGCHILSSFAWDIKFLANVSDSEINSWAQDEREAVPLITELRAATPFFRLETFAGFVTLGTNMPLFTFTYGPERVFPITKPRSEQLGIGPPFPGAKLPEALAAKARWVNIYSPKDLLGYPLKPLNPAYNQEKRLDDVAIRVEGGPLDYIGAHTRYWTNNRCAVETAKLLRDVIET